MIFFQGLYVGREVREILFTGQGMTELPQIIFSQRAFPLGVTAVASRFLDFIVSAAVGMEFHTDCNRHYKIQKSFSTRKMRNIQRTCKFWNLHCIADT